MSTAFAEPAAPGLPKEEIDAQIQKDHSKIQRCYQRALWKDPQVSGEMEISFTIAPDGAVSEAGVTSSTLGATDLEECVVERFLEMSFREPVGGGQVVVSYPFAFQPAYQRPLKSVSAIPESVASEVQACADDWAEFREETPQGIYFSAVLERRWVERIEIETPHIAEEEEASLEACLSQAFAPHRYGWPPPAEVMWYGVRLAL